LTAELLGMMVRIAAAALPMPNASKPAVRPMLTTRYQPEGVRASSAREPPQPCFGHRGVFAWTGLAPQRRRRAAAAGAETVAKLLVSR
jgi:hypothetical protein